MRHSQIEFTSAAPWSLLARQGMARLMSLPVCAYVTVAFSVLYFHFLCLEWVNDETYLNVELGRLLEEGTFECRNVEKIEGCAKARDF